MSVKTFVKIWKFQKVSVDLQSLKEIVITTNLKIYDYGKKIGFKKCEIYMGTRIRT